MASRIDWDDKLGRKPYGLAVEGKTDKLVIEKFLDVGGWDNWRAQLSIEPLGKRDNVLLELNHRKEDKRIWGLIDNDERATHEISQLQQTYPRLLVLPRWMIENYFIHPSELSNMQIAIVETSLNFEEIHKYRHAGIKHGALWHTLYERDAFQFCRGHQDGYPMAILSNIQFDDAHIAERLSTWQSHLNSTDIMKHYQHKLAQFEEQHHDNYARHIHGKYFFAQIVVQKVLNRIQQKPVEDWFDLLIEGIRECPDDIKRLLQQMIA